MESGRHERMPSEEEIAEANRLAERLGLEPPIYVGNFPFKKRDEGSFDIGDGIKVEVVSDQEELDALNQYANRFDSDLGDIIMIPEITDLDN